jgi:hypothetical protein
VLQAAHSVRSRGSSRAIEWWIRFLNRRNKVE